MVTGRYPQPQRHDPTVRSKGQGGGFGRQRGTLASVLKQPTTRTFFKVNGIPG